MLAAIVRSSLAHPRIVTALSVLIAVLGAAALLGARFDVFPDFAPPHVLVQTETPGSDATFDSSARSIARPSRTSDGASSGSGHAPLQRYSEINRRTRAAYR